MTLPPEFAIRPGSSSTSRQRRHVHRDIHDPTESERRVDLERFVRVRCGPTSARSNLALRFDAMPGFTLGTFTSSIGAESNDGAPLNLPRGGPRFGDLTPQSRTPRRSASRTIRSRSDTSRRRATSIPTAFDVPVGDSLEVSLSHLTRDYQLVLYAPDGSDTSQSLRPSTRAQGSADRDRAAVDPSGMNTGCCRLRRSRTSRSRREGPRRDLRLPRHRPRVPDAPPASPGPAGTRPTSRRSRARTGHTATSPTSLRSGRSDADRSCRLPPSVTLPSVSPSGATMPPSPPLTATRLSSSTTSARRSSTGWQ